ncbi:hypothetical protein J2W55_002757 [Mucilaginibacter pocheonensis]|uniref:Uncharacterized protein n=1 Tax=Mucilaginibacter pocheonensis TaxID=398050 RepID=A0ABU1TC86_9SPHI|nr:hypothetical protein [Mucilaginibacter pocheonensis]
MTVNDPLQGTHTGRKGFTDLWKGDVDNQNIQL